MEKLSEVQDARKIMVSTESAMFRKCALFSKNYLATIVSKICKAKENGVTNHLF